MVTFPYYSEESFRFSLIKGQIAKELVKGLLEKSKYHVYPFGYESTISKLRYDVQHRRGVKHTASNDRIRSMPDLMVYDDQNLETTFVEVKFRKTDSAEHVRLNNEELRRCKVHWSDSFLVVVVPADHYFYAKKIDSVEIPPDGKTHQYNLIKDFQPLEKAFPQIDSQLVRNYRAILDQFKSAFPLEQDEE